jgi:ATP-dependent RNA helicase DeaD
MGGHMEKITFSALGLSPEILKAVDALGFEEASPIQAAAIPVLMTGADLVGQSQTGSGKTAAFAIPALEALDRSSKAVQVLVMCPTRELATQVADEVHKLIAYMKGVSCVPIYGGASYDRQFFELKKGVQVVIGTPGRIIDHIDRGTLNLSSLKTVILDEADRMLDMGFRDDIQQILDSTPHERQTVFFSATLSPQIRDLIKRYSSDPQTIKIEPRALEIPAIEQFYYEVPHRAKLEALIRLIDFHGFKLGIIFCNTQRMVDELADTLLAQGFSADRLHGGIAQAQRTRVMNKFKKSEFEFLVATDVAARGIDVDDLQIVVNYDLPFDAEDYVHRIGRTGRAGKRGMAATFVSGRDIYKLQFIERYTKTKIRRGQMPTAGEVVEKKTDALLETVRAMLKSEAGKGHAPLVERLLEEGFSSTELAAALFQMLVGTPQEPEKTERRERPERSDRPERPDRGPRDERPERPARSDHPERPTREDDRMERKSQRDDRDQPVLRKPGRGLAWISLNVGWHDGFGPREIVDAIEEGTGMPGRSVGDIEITNTGCFAQVPEDFVNGLSGESNTLSAAGREIQVGVVRRTETAGAFGARSGGGKPKFAGKPGGKFAGKFGDKKKNWKDRKY